VHIQWISYLSRFNLPHSFYFHFICDLIGWSIKMATIATSYGNTMIFALSMILRLKLVNVVCPNCSSCINCDENFIADKKICIWKKNCSPRQDNLSKQDRTHVYMRTLFQLGRTIKIKNIFMKIIFK
jgi:hypothetical protein